MTSRLSPPLGGPKPGLEVGQYVLHRLDPDGQSDEVGSHPGRRLLRFGQLGVGGRCRVDGQASDVTDVGQVAEQLESFDEFPARVGPAGNPEGDNRPAALRADSAAAARAMGSIPVPDRSPNPPRPGLEPLGHGGRVLDVTFHPEAQGFQALEEEKGIEGGDRGPVSLRYCNRAFRTNRAGKRASGSCPKTSP